MSYFVTGATGFIGRHLVQELLANREGAQAAQGLPIDQGLALEARLGRERITGALEGARRFRVRP